MSDPVVSVLLPYRNNAATIDEAIGSIVAQRGVSFELVAVDDGSTDEGPAIARARTKGLVNVTHLATGGVGIVRALAAAREHARGLYLARMDGDDLAHPERLGKQLEALTRRDRPENLALVATRVRVFPEDVARERRGVGLYVEWQNGLVSHEDHARELFVESPVCHPSVMYTRESFDALGGYRDPPWPEDYDLWLRYDEAGYAIEKLPEVLLSWRMHSGNLTFSSERYALRTFRMAKGPFLAKRLRSLGKPLALWGAGPTGKRLARELELHGVRAEFFVDVDPAKVGSTARGAPIVGPDALARGSHTVVCAVGARGARALIRAELTGRGFVEGSEFLFAS